MAVNRSRSQNAELQEGFSDGTVKKIPRDRSNVSFPSAPGAERRMLGWIYGFEDAPMNYRPDGAGVARRNPGDHG